MAELAYREVYAMNRVEARRRLVQTYQRTRNYSETARLWHTSRHVVRKWVRRHQKLGDAGLCDRSRRPHHTPRQTPPEIEQQVLDAREKTRYGRQRLSIWRVRGYTFLHTPSAISCTAITHPRNASAGSLSIPPIGLGK